MNHLEFFNSLKTNIEKCYVMYGMEEFVKESGINALKNCVVQKDFEDFNLNILNEGATVEAVIETAETLPFMGDKRLVMAMNCKSFLTEMDATTIKRLETFLMNLPDTTCLALVFRGEIDKRKKSFKMLSKYACMVNFDYLDADMATKWVNSTVSKKGKTIDYKTARLLVDAVGTSCMDLNNEIGKLLEQVGDKENIEKDDLSSIKSFVVEHDVFNMINLLLNNHTKAGFEILYKSMKDGESGFMILGALSSKFRNIMVAKQMKTQGLGNNVIIKELGGNYSAKKAVSECDRITFLQIERGLVAFLEADYNIKNGVMSETMAVETAVLKAFSKE